MKTFEEKWTAWLDGQLTGKELIEFEASLPDKAAAKLEKRDAKKLGALLKRELGAHVIANEEFFSHQLRERIARENIEPFREQAAEVPTWWTIRRLFWTETVWSGLVIAENVAQPESIPPELTRIERLLKDLFGYNQFQVIGQSSKTLKTGQEDWLATSKFFGLRVDARGESEAGYVLNLKLYKEKELLLETDAKLSKRSPLVIKGPQVGSGQLLLVLVVQ